MIPSNVFWQTSHWEHEAYQSILEGRISEQRTEADLRHSIDYFQKAIELDPNYALLTRE